MSGRPATRITLGRLGRAVGLSRTALLYYESLGLLVPRDRSPAGYRLYGTGDIERLQSIRRLRDAGLALADIRDLLLKPPQASAAPEPAALLEKRLLALCDSMNRIREQQRLLARLLAIPGFRSRRQHRDKAAWVALLHRAGFNDADMRRWHVEFERDDPDGHAAFLKSLGIGRSETEQIRRWSRSEGKEEA
jgi:MerR family transcriptional regulator, thiopeptide resistance regulator